MARKIGFAGIGIMGRGMVLNLLKAGNEVTVYNRTRSRAEELASSGAKVADTPAEVAQGKDIVITMLSDPPAIESVLFDDNGILKTLEKGAVLIDCSTVDPTTTASCKKAAESVGAKFIDCPVSGSKDGAMKGELILMMGGDVETINSVRDAMEAVSSRIIHAGQSGSGTMLKLCFNLFVSHMGAALAESMVMGVKSGLKPEDIISTIMAGMIGSKFYEWKGGCIMDRDFSTNFSTKLLHKDTGLIMNAANGLNVPLPVTAAVRELFGMAKASGLGDEDFCSVVKVLEEYAGVEVKR